MSLLDCNLIYFLTFLTNDLLINVINFRPSREVLVIYHDYDSNLRGHAHESVQASSVLNEPSPSQMI